MIVLDTENPPCSLADHTRANKGSQYALLYFASDIARTKTSAMALLALSEHACNV